MLSFSLMSALRQAIPTKNMPRNEMDTLDFAVKPFANIASQRDLLLVHRSKRRLLPEFDKIDAQTKS
jgi:hypothetical protein